MEPSGELPLLLGKLAMTAFFTEAKSLDNNLKLNLYKNRRIKWV